MRNLPLILVLALVFTGCWSKNFDEPGRMDIDKKPTEMIVGGSFQRVWAATLAVMGKFVLVQKDVEPNSSRAYLVTDWTKGKSDTLYHGFDVNRIPFSIRYRLYIYLVADRGGIRVTIKNEEQYLDDAITSGVDFNGSLYQWINTESSTLKENRLVTEIDRLVRDPSFKSE